ncbi:MAG: hypothetical protein NUV74_06965, partial [Candidatus Brocadiaceae bacterium]|nr:hypothetical protein [Candidatus Brocadiaceae bacterium]
DKPRIQIHKVAIMVQSCCYVSEKYLNRLFALCLMLVILLYASNTSNAKELPEEVASKISVEARIAPERALTFEPRRLFITINNSSDVALDFRLDFMGTNISFSGHQINRIGGASIHRAPFENYFTHSSFPQFIIPPHSKFEASESFVLETVLISHDGEGRVTYFNDVGFYDVEVYNHNMDNVAIPRCSLEVIAPTGDDIELEQQIIQNEFLRNRLFNVVYERNWLLDQWRELSRLLSIYKNSAYRDSTYGNYLSFLKARYLERGFPDNEGEYAIDEMNADPELAHHMLRELALQADFPLLPSVLSLLAEDRHIEDDERLGFETRFRNEFPGSMERLLYLYGKMLQESGESSQLAEYFGNQPQDSEIIFRNRFANFQEITIDQYESERGSGQQTSSQDNPNGSSPSDESDDQVDKESSSDQKSEWKIYLSSVPLYAWAIGIFCLVVVVIITITARRLMRQGFWSRRQR